MPFVRAGRTIVSSNQIAPGIIVDSDVNASADIAGSKLQALSVGANAGVIPSTGVVNAHIAAAAAIAFSKLAALTQGSVLVGGPSNVATDLGAGTSTYVLTSNGAGNTPSWQQPTGGWVQLGETTLGASAASIDVSGFSARKDLRVVIWIESKTGACTVRVTFNGDTGSNYGYQYMGDAIDEADQNAVAFIQPNGASGADLNPLYSELNIINQRTGFRKGGTILTASLSTTATNAPGNVGHGGFVWNNTSAQITQVTVTASANQFGANSRVTVYGKTD